MLRGRRGWTVLAAVLGAVLMVSVGTAFVSLPSDSGPSKTRIPARSEAGERPNIVMLLVDDLETTIDLGEFPNLSRLAAEGSTFTNMVVTDSWCCPSRASILRSQYVHSHKVYINRGETGGWIEFFKRGHEKSTVATWLQDAGYRTGFTGKYLNHYPKKYFAKTRPADRYKTHLPPGWDDWNAIGQRGYHGFGYGMHGNGKVRYYGNAEKDYATDVMAEKAANFIEDTPAGRPFFLYVSPFVPHLPATPAPRHRDSFPGARAPRTPSFLQKDFSKEPLWMRRMPSLTPKEVAKQDRKYRKRLQSMLAVDDMAGTIMKKLRAEGRLDNTYFVFTSDNGYHTGQHGMPMGKSTPFEEDVRVPMIVRGPGVAPGSRVSQHVSTVDLGPTFVDLAGARPPGFAEGRSFAPLLRGERPDDWRRANLIEFFARKGWKAAGPDCDERVVLGRGCPLPHSYAALRTSRYTYVEYVTGERQLYDRYKDPHQLDNIVKEADDGLVRDLSRRLRSFAACTGTDCRTADTE